MAAALKKMILAAAGLLILATGACAPALRACTAADLVPAGTLIFLSLPDPGRTAAAWPSTELAQLAGEPEVRAFLERPLSTLPPISGLAEIVAQSSSFQPNDAFLALAGVNQGSGQLRLMAGFQFKGNRAAVEAVLASPKKLLLSTFPGGRVETLTRRTYAIEVYHIGATSYLIASVFADHRYLVANDVDLLNAALDHLDGQGAPGDALSADAEFGAVMRRMPPAYETFTFARPRLLAQKLFVGGATPEFLTQISPARALGATTSFDRGKLRDTIFAVIPGLPAVTATGANAGAEAAPPFAPTGDTLACGWMRTGPSLTGIPVFVTGKDTFLERCARLLADWSLRAPNFNGAFGGRLGAQLDWNADDSDPGMAVSVELLNRAAAEAFLGWLGTSGGGEWKTVFLAGALSACVSERGAPGGGLAVALTERRLLIGGDLDELRRLAARELAEGSTPSAAPEQGADKGVNAAFAFVDTRALFARAYDAFRPLAAVAGLVYPKLSRKIDLNKLPDGAVVARHLSPTFLSGRLEENGLLIESAGTITLPQAAAAMIVGSWRETTHRARKSVPARRPAHVTPGENGSAKTAPSGTER